MIRKLVHFRVLKTVTAAFMAMVVGQIFDPWPIFIVLSASFCIRQTFMSSLDHFYDELKIAFMATGIALLVGEVMELEYLVRHYEHYLPFLSYFLTALAVGLVVAVTQYFKLYNVLLFGLLTVSYILLDRPGTTIEPGVFFLRSIVRLGQIMLGSLMALVVDFLFSGFEYRSLFHRRTKQVLEQVDQMLDLFIEAIMFQSANMMDQTLDLMVESQNLLNYVVEKLDDLEKELELRGGEIHGFDNRRLSLLQDILQNFRLISFQVEAGAVNYIELARRMEGESEAEIIPEADYARLSSKGRELARMVSALQEAVDKENPEALEQIIECELSGVDYRQLFQEMEEGQVRLLAVDILSAISRIEYNLCQSAQLIHEYLTKYR